VTEQHNVSAGERQRARNCANFGWSNFVILHL
jgi:hypothetical protein